MIPNETISYNIKSSQIRVLSINLYFGFNILQYIQHVAHFDMHCIKGRSKKKTKLGYFRSSKASQKRDITFFPFFSLEFKIRKSDRQQHIIINYTWNKIIFFISTFSDCIILYVFFVMGKKFQELKFHILYIEQTMKLMCFYFRFNKRTRSFHPYKPLYCL